MQLVICLRHAYILCINDTRAIMYIRLMSVMNEDVVKNKLMRHWCINFLLFGYFMLHFPHNCGTHKYWPFCFSTQVSKHTYTHNLRWVMSTAEYLKNGTRVCSSSTALICSRHAAFVTMFSTLFNNCTLVLKIVHDLAVLLFKSSDADFLYVGKG